MTDAVRPTATSDEWFRGIAELSSRYGAEPLIAMLGSTTGDLTDEARGAALEIGRTYVRQQADLRDGPPLTIVGSPLPTE